MRLSMAMEISGAIPLMTSSWGLTETAPSAFMQQTPTDRSGVVGVPVPGVTAKLIPLEGERYEVRVKGPNIMPGYFENPEKTAESFDEDGFFISGDAMRLVDPADFNRGMRIDGRLSEDFKLLTGTWVRAAQVRLDMLACLAPIASDVVITGADRGEIGIMLFPNADELAREGFSADATDGAFTDTRLLSEVHRRLAERAREVSGSASRVTRAIVLAEPPSMPDGEMTAKGNLNFRKVLARRADLLNRLYDDAQPDAAVVRL